MKNPHHVISNENVKDGIKNIMVWTSFEGKRLRVKLEIKKGEVTRVGIKHRTKYQLRKAIGIWNAQVKSNKKEYAE